MRPMLWGTIWFVIGFIGWITLSVIYGIGEGLGVESNPTSTFLLYAFGIVFFFSLPIAVIAEIIRWVKIKVKGVKVENFRN